MSRSDGLRWGARGALAGVLLAAGILKAGAGVVVVDAGGLAGLPAGLALPLLAALPWLEIALGVWLLSEGPLRPAAWAALAMTAGFVGLTAWRLASEGWSPDCGCFGPLRAPLDRWHLAMNVGLLALAAWLCWSLRRAPPASAT